MIGMIFSGLPIQRYIGNHENHKGEFCNIRESLRYSRIHPKYGFRPYPIQLSIGHPMKIMQIICRVSFLIFHIQRMTPGTHSPYDFLPFQAENREYEKFTEFTLIYNRDKFQNGVFRLERQWIGKRVGDGTEM